MRSITGLRLLAGAAASVAAQDPDRAVAGGGELPAGWMARRTDGIAGLRVNHNLDAHVSAFGITRKRA